MLSANEFAHSIIKQIVPADCDMDGPEVGTVFLQELSRMTRESDRLSRKKLASVARLIYNEAVNLNYDIDSNGERQLISKVCSSGDTVFDVGANQGSWTQAVLDESPGANIHSFELIPHTAKRLKAALKGRPATINSCGLSDSEGDIQANYCPEHSELSGIYDVHANFKMEQVKCRLTTGNIYCNIHKIDRIRLLKIDCEGAELAVLKGFSLLLQNRQIDVIQFEYGKANITSRSSLLDFYRLLESYGYTTGKLYPDGVDFKPYALDDEDFTGPNYVACSPRTPEIKDRLKHF